MSAERRSALASIMRRAHEAARRMRNYFDSYRDALSAALRRVYAAASARDFLAASVGRALLVRFVKADGSVRVMRLRCDESRFDATLRADLYGMVPVLDLDTQLPRRINLDTLGWIKPAPAPDRMPAPRRDTPPPSTAPVAPAAPRSFAVIDALPMEQLTSEELDVLSEGWFG